MLSSGPIMDRSTAANASLFSCFNSAVAREAAADFAVGLSSLFLSARLLFLASVAWQTPVDCFALNNGGRTCRTVCFYEKCDPFCQPHSRNSRFWCQIATHSCSECRSTGRRTDRPLNALHPKDRLETEETDHDTLISKTISGQ